MKLTCSCGVKTTQREHHDPSCPIFLGFDPALGDRETNLMPGDRLVNPCLDIEYDGIDHETRLRNAFVAGWEARGKKEWGATDKLAVEEAFEAWRS